MTRIWTRQTILRRASAADIPAIMDIERQPGYDQLVGRWSAEQHLENISKPGYLYFVHDDSEGMPIAFAALSGMGASKGEVLINRLMVKTPGRGTGKIFLREIMTVVFEGAPTSRLWLRVRPENERALRLYRAQGFAEEKLLPQAGTTPDGKRVDLFLMAISYEDWAAHQ
jgi:ribosomal protein S18 acetylase RimI-like enzyme